MSLPRKLIPTHLQRFKVDPSKWIPQQGAQQINSIQRARLLAASRGYDCSRAVASTAVPEVQVLSVDAVRGPSTQHTPYMLYSYATSWLTMYIDSRTAAFGTY